LPHNDAKREIFQEGEVCSCYTCCYLATVWSFG